MRAASLVAACAISVAHAVDFIDVFVGGIGGYDCYRIPAIVQLGNGTLIAFAEGRRFSCDDHGWNDIVQRSSFDLGASWGPITVTYGESSRQQNVTIGNPAPVVLADGKTILMPYCRNNLNASVLRSSDGGNSWSLDAPLPVPNGWSWIATGPPGSIQLPSGRIVVPIDAIQAGARAESSASYVSDDGGHSWTLSPFIPGGNEAQAAPMPWVGPSTLLMSMRSTSTGSRLAAVSNDGGSTWSAPWSTVSETQCEGSTISLPAHPAGARLVLSSAFSTSSRSNMTIHSSVDNGHTWKAVIQVYPGGSAYSALVPLPSQGGDAIGLLFEKDNYSKISYVTLKVPA